MAANTKGTAHFFGVGATLTNATIQSIDAQSGFDLNETTENETGVTIESRRDNRRKELTVTARIRTGYTFPVEGAVIAISGMQDNSFNGNYELTSKGQQYNHAQHLEQALTLVQHEGITYTA
jgi:hypothetical protein